MSESEFKPTADWEDEEGDVLWWSAPGQGQPWRGRRLSNRWFRSWFTCWCRIPSDKLGETAKPASGTRFPITFECEIENPAWLRSYFVDLWQERGMCDAPPLKDLELMMIMTDLDIGGPDPEDCGFKIASKRVGK